VPSDGKEASRTCASPSTSATELFVVPKSNPIASIGVFVFCIPFIISYRPAASGAMRGAEQARFRWTANTPHKVNGYRNRLDASEEADENSRLPPSETAMRGYCGRQGNRISK